MYETLDPKVFQQLTGYDYSQIAEILGYDPHSVRRWFFGDNAKHGRSPNKLVLRELARYYNENFA